MNGTTRWQSFAWLLVFLLPGTSVVCAQSENPQSDIDPASDLRTVIILAGYPCNTLVDYFQPTDSAYHVSCDSDRHYRIDVSEEEGVVVHRQSNAATPESQEAASHDAIMKQHLLSVVNLAGHDCTGVSSYERHVSNGHIVTCEDQAVYRIHVTPEGRIAVDKQPFN